ncbi:MAG: signal peptide peptidase SppA [Candidatus Binatia bacterium]|nr:signal peptide peptidase SppA [Candidatus Binatia bacterium]
MARILRRRKILMLLFLALMAVGLWTYIRRGPHVSPGSVLLVTLSGSYPESPPEGLWAKVFAPRETTLPELVLTLRRATVDPRIRAIVARFTELDVGWAKANEIRDLLAAARRKGKTTIALLEADLGNANLPYYIATACERVYVAPGAHVALRGLVARYFFLGGLWEKLHIEMDVEKIAEYKTAGDTLAGKEMSAAHREMANSLLDSVEELYLGTVAMARGVGAEEIRAVIHDVGPSGAAQLLQAGLVDGAKYLEDLWSELGVERDLIVTSETYARVAARALGLETGPRVAVILVSGTIASGESQGSGAGSIAGADTIRAALDEASRNREIRAIILRVDSPGGSALAADMIWRAVREARRRKPVIAAFSDVAASGGYYIASGSTKIVAQPGTLTGSIGVVFARPMIRGLLANWGITIETLARGRLATLDDVTSPLDDETRDRLRKEVQATYELFLQRVSEGRGLAKEQVHDVGRGRVWTGSQAKERGLVDTLGGFYTAVELAKQEAGIPAEEDPELIFLPPPRPWWEALAESAMPIRVRSVPAVLYRLFAAVPGAFEPGPEAIMAEQVWVR